MRIKKIFLNDQSLLTSASVPLTKALPYIALRSAQNTMGPWRLNLRVRPQKRHLQNRNENRPWFTSRCSARAPLIEVTAGFSLWLQICCWPSTQNTPGSSHMQSSWVSQESEGFHHFGCTEVWYFSTRSHTLKVCLYIPSRGLVTPAGISGSHLVYSSGPRQY